MEWFVRAFMRASLGWLVLGVTLGIAMTVHPAWRVFRTAHLHMNLVGFVAMMIFGVAYYVIPRFFGQPLYGRRLATAQWWLSNVGLAGMVAGFMMQAYNVRGWLVIEACGGVLQAGGAYVFAYNIWRTIGAARVMILPLAEK
ncbi:MAG TPA: cbb3-type cytochrome c oxidase subunit I [Gemmatimonadales bacterium]